MKTIDDMSDWISNVNDILMNQDIENLASIQEVQELLAQGSLFPIKLDMMNELSTQLDDSLRIEKVIAEKLNETRMTFD